VGEGRAEEEEEGRGRLEDVAPLLLGPLVSLEDEFVGWFVSWSRSFRNSEGFASMSLVRLRVCCNSKIQISKLVLRITLQFATKKTNIRLNYL
jgi:hypothetical protein